MITKKSKRTGRFCSISRKTSETDISLSLNLDGKGKYSIDSGIPFFNHMLEQFSKHSRFDMTIKAKGDVEVDIHHLIEDTGIVIGAAMKESSGDKIGIRRFGGASVPMDEALVNTSVDFSGRPFFVFNYGSKDMLASPYPGQFSGVLKKYGSLNNKNALREIFVDKFFGVYLSIFFDSLCKNALMTLHINIAYGTNAHHMVEAAFKSAAMAISGALTLTGSKELPSTKGRI